MSAIALTRTAEQLMGGTSRERATRFWTLTLIGLPAVVVPLSIAAQSATVVGVVTERDTGAPLQGVYVALVAQDGGVVQAAALTGESGRVMLRAAVGATYRLRAERVGMASVTTDPFTLADESMIHRVSLAEEAIEVEGLTVPTPVRLCDIDAAEALTVQRWWDEIRKALQSAAFVHANELDRFHFERFQREWTRDLRGLRAERYFAVDASAARPFLSQDAETLSEAGFVQGEVGERRFLAPDAAVLLSRPFLRDHCFGLEPVEDERTNVRISVGPTESREVTEIQGFMEIDTLTMELRSFDFEYVNLPDDIPPSAAAGGHLSFEYLPSGAWIVSEWWVRMPWVDARVFPRTVLAYVDEGGRVAGLATEPGVLDDGSRGATLHGVVYDSLHGRPLGDARVSVVGSRTSTRTSQAGTFSLAGVPSGQARIAVHHPDLVRLGIPSPVIPVELEEGGVDSIAVTLPGFAAVAGLLCPDAPELPQSILTGSIREPGTDTPVGASTELRARWLAPAVRGGRAVSVYAEGRTGSDGRYVLCGLPSGVPLSLGVRFVSGWRAAGTATLPERSIVPWDLRPEPDALDAVVRGYVDDGSTGSALSSATVSLIDTDGESITSASTDVSGQFRIVLPRAGEFMVSAFSHGYTPQSSDTLSIIEGDVLDLHFEMSPVLAVQRVRGRVLDAANGRPVPLAGVSTCWTALGVRSRSQ